MTYQKHLSYPPTPPPPTSTVGGVYIPTNKLELLAPYVGLVVLLAVAAVTVVYVKKREKA